MHHPNRLTLLDLRHLAGESLDRRITGDKQTGNIIQIAHIAQTIAEGKCQLIAAIFGDSQRCAVGGAVGPYPGARRFAGDVGDFVAHFAHVGIDALVKLLVAFVASAGFIIKAVGNRRFAAALWIGLNTVVRSPGMRADFNQRRLRELAHHLPGGETLARSHQTAEIDFFLSRRIDPAAYRRP